MPTLADIMTNAVVAVDPDETVQRIQAIFEETRFHHVLVTEDGRLVGVISDRDLLRHVSPFLGRMLMERGQDANTLKLKAHQIMTRRPITGDPETNVDEAASLMLEHRFGCLPVVCGRGKLVGIVAWRDLLRAAYGAEHEAAA